MEDGILRAIRRAYGAPNLVAPLDPPRPGSALILPLVLHDIEDKAERGRQKYGTHLEANNGRDALVDAYQEAIDLVMYLRQAIFERDNR